MPNIAHFVGGIYLGLLKQLFGSDSGSRAGNAGHMRVYTTQMSSVLIGGNV